MSRENWVNAVNRGETTSGLADWENRPRATIKVDKDGDYAVSWDGEYAGFRYTFGAAKRFARRLERKHRWCREWNEETS